MCNYYYHCSLISRVYVMLQKYQEWKDSLPDLSWLEDILSNNDQVNSIQNSLKSILDTVKNIDFGKNLKCIVKFSMEELKYVKILKYLVSKLQTV